MSDVKPHNPEENMPRYKKMCAKLTPAEAKRLEQFVEKSGGQVKASILLEVAPETLSRSINRHTAPSTLLRSKLAELGVLTA